MEARELRAPLSLVRSARASGGDVKALQHILVSASGANVALVGGNGALEIEVKIPGKLGDYSGAVASQLVDFVDHLPDDASLSLSKTASHAQVSAGKARARVPALPADAFPRIRAGEPTTRLAVDSASLISLLRFVETATSDNGATPALNSVSLELANNSLRAVATNGFVLAVAVVGATEFQGGEVKALLPAHALSHLLRIARAGKTVQLGVSDNEILAVAGGTRLVAKRTVGEFPNWRNIVASEPKNTAEIERAAVLAVVERVVAMGDPKVPQLTLCCKGGLTEIATKSERGEAAESVNLAGLEDFEAAVNGRFLADALTAFNGEKVTLGINAAGQLRFTGTSDAMRGLRLLAPRKQ